MSPSEPVAAQQQQQQQQSDPPAKRVKITSDDAPVPAAMEPCPPLQVKKLSDKARLPTRGSLYAAGYDLYAAKATTIPARGKALVSTDIAISVPAGTYGRIAPRSGLAAKNFIDTGAGVIDADYRGEVKVLLFNHADADFEVAEGDRVAQLVVERIFTPEIVEVAELEESVRGAGGFGSTGVALA
ncbi:deoxyuridine 5'-triphosphate nucleotidohydrolase [Colletotrichum tabaci]|uniref:Deoxyuridine 5'-triphosphate nucleotidohydrolase n=1 Tax=Colletotrichum tabaci TaxID=1209068 RepID=A0AAV9TYL0_9PEZI